MEQNKGINVVLLGKTGAGKSSTGNTILGREAFDSKKSSRSLTRVVAVQSRSVGHFPVTVYDTPGLFDTDMTEDEIEQKYKEVLQRCESGPCVFLLVIKADRFTEEEREAVEKIEKLLGEERLKKTWILFSRGDDLEEENMTINEFINETEPLKNLVQKYDQRYHVFNNKTNDQAGQVQELFIKILKPHMNSLGDVLETLKQNPLMRKIPQEIEPGTPADSSRRLVLLGQSGVGKSAAGNTILGQREFESVQRMSSVTSKCSEAHVTVSGRSVSVVDTPGLFDTEINPEELAEELARSVCLSSPGPHAFLIVFAVNMRFTEREQVIPQMIEMMFGQEVLKYSFILLTHGDQLEEEPVEEIIEQNCRLRALVQQCGGRYHIFSNKDLNNREQVNDLLQKIDSMIEQNGGGHYSNQMFEDALRFRREEEQRQREEEQRKQQEEFERVKKETEEEIRAEYEAERSELERLRAEKQREEENRKQQEEKQRLEEERIGEVKETSGFKHFITKHQHVFVVAGATVGAIAAAPLGFVAGVAAFAAGGAATASAGRNIAGVADGSQRRQRKDEERKQQEEKQRQEEIERVKKEIEERVRAESAYRSERERLRAGRQRYKENRKRQEEIERLKKEIEERVRAESAYRSEQERLGAERQRYEENRKRQEEIERVIKETEERVRLRAVRQRYEENRKRQEETERVKKEIEERVRAESVYRSERERLGAVSLPSRRLVLLGKSGAGKSAAGNTILGQREFISVMSTSSVTRKCSEAHATVSGRSVSVVDTPGFFDTQMRPDELAEEIARSVCLSSPGPHAFLIVFSVNMRFTEQEQQIPQIIEMMFGEEVLKYSFILFTHGDQLEEESVEKLIEQNSRLRDLVQKCGGRYHVFNNKDLNNREQVNDLLQKIDSVMEQNALSDAQRYEKIRKRLEKQIEACVCSCS